MWGEKGKRDIYVNDHQEKPRKTGSEDVRR